MTPTTYLDDARRLLAKATRPQRPDDAQTTALVGIGHALLALAGADVPVRVAAGTHDADTLATTVRNWSVRTGQIGEHGPNVCGYDFDALGDIVASARRPERDALDAWLREHDLDRSDEP